MMIYLPRGNQTPQDHAPILGDTHISQKPCGPADLHEQAFSARTFAHALTERERRYERAFHAGASPATDADAGAKVQQAISHLRKERKRRQRYVVDVKTGEQIDVITDGYYDLGANDLTPDGRIERRN